MDRRWRERLSEAHPGLLGMSLGVAFFGIAVLLPIGCMLWSTVSWKGSFTLEGWRSVLGTRTDWVQLWHSLELGFCGTAVAGLLGLGQAWFTVHTDVPGARSWMALAVAPLVVPPILVAMAISDLVDARGLWACAGILGVVHAPLVAILVGRGIRTTDGRAYEAAWLARGRPSAERWLLRAVGPELGMGLLLSFILIVSDHGVPEFLTVRGKTWHTYSEGIFARWVQRTFGEGAASAASPVVAAIPLCAVIGVATWMAFRLRGRTLRLPDPHPLPRRTFGARRWFAMGVPIAYLALTLLIPIYVLGRWAAGGMQVSEPPSFARFVASFRGAVEQAGGDIVYTLEVAVTAALLVGTLAAFLGWWAARRYPWIDGWAVLPLAVPPILLGMGYVRVFNRDFFGAFYEGPGIVATSYAARFMPFGVWIVSATTRRIPLAQEEAGRLSGRSPWSRGLRVLGPPLAPAILASACLSFVLALRELDLAVLLPAGNGTVVRRLSNMVHYGGEDVGGALALILIFFAATVPSAVAFLYGGGGRRP